MKKTTPILLSVLLLTALILFTPIPKGSFDDGGSREYQALTYKIIRWNRLSDDGVYRHTNVYWGADRHLSPDELFAREISYMPVVDAPPIANKIDFEAQYIRTDGYHEDALYPAVTVIRSQQELDTYYHENKALYALEPRENPATDSTIGFLDACDRYDDTFFKDKALILILLEEPSGSIRHKITSVQQHSNGKLTLNIFTISPEIGTDDLAQWHLFVEVATDIDNEDDITLCFPSSYDGEYTAQHRDVVYQNRFAEVVMSLPDGWAYDPLDHGVRFYPKGQSGYLRLSYTEAFGVCGTGLQYDTIILSGYEAEQGTYDNHTLWDYIVLPKEWNAVGDYVILNEGADAWWDEFGDEAMAILNGIKIYEKITMEDKAITYAKEVCDVEYDIILAEFDTAQAVWNIVFLIDDIYTDGGGQTVTVDGFTGEILAIEYGE